MQKQKNLLPGLFLCVFSRTAEPLVDFIAVIFGFSFFYLGQTFFAGKKGVSGPFYIGPFYTGPFCAPIPQKTRARRAFTARLYLACRRAPRKAPTSARPQPLKNYPFGALYRKPCLVYAHKGPHAKTPGVIPGVWLMKSSFNLRLTHCGRFLAGCTGPACSRRPQ